MKKFTVILIDDEPLAIDVLKVYLANFPEFIIEKTFTKPIEAIKYINNTSIDLVFTDIAMPQISGTELVQMTNQKTQFVIVTSFTEYAIESFELNVIDYLLKPVSLNRFTKTIQRFKDSYKSSIKDIHSKIISPSFFIKEGDEYIKVIIKDIDYIEGMKDYAKIIRGNNYYLVLKTLKSIEEKLSEFDFLRVHKSYIVPLKKITQYNNKSILIDKHEIPVGSNYRNQLKKFLENNKL